MAFSAKQVQALRRQPNRSHIRAQIEGGTATNISAARGS